MSDAEFLLLILAAIYLFECVFWIRPGAFVFSTQLGEKYRRANLRYALLRNHDGGALLGNLIPTGHACVSEQWPLSLSPDGVYAYVAQAVSSDGRPALSEKFVRFEHVRRVEYQAADIYINGAFFLRAASAPFAGFLARLIRELSAADRDKRGLLIDAALHSHFDVQAVRTRLAAFRSATAVLRVNCLMLFFLVFMFFPLTIYLQPNVDLLPLVLTYPALVVTIALQFWLAHRRLYPDLLLERVKHTLIMLISPADAMQARNRIGRAVLALYHPLVVSRALCRRDDFATLAAEAVRDLHFPILPICPADDDGPRATEEWFRQRLQTVVETCITTEGLTLEEALRPPQLGHTAQTYCPRCLGEFELATGECWMCGERPLVAVK